MKRLIPVALGAFLAGSLTGSLLGTTALAPIHLAPGQQITIYADAPAPMGPSCEWVGTPVVNPSRWGDYYTGMGVSASGLVPGQQYSAWAYGVTASGHWGYGVTDTKAADAYGHVTLTFVQLEVIIPSWEADVYTVPGTATSNTVADCDWTAP